MSCAEENQTDYVSPRQLSRRFGPVLAAVGLHLALFVAALVDVANPATSEPPPPEAKAVSVSLFSMNSDVSAASADISGPASAVDALQQRLASAEGGSTPSLDAPAARGSLDELFGPMASGAPSPARGAAEAAGSARAGDPRDQVSLVRPGGLRGSGDGPCWRRPERPLPVVMQVMLDEAGGVIGRPRVLRKASPAAEAQAWRAMAGCAPYVAVTAGRYRALELDFAGGRDWVRPAGFVDVR